MRRKSIRQNVKSGDFDDTKRDTYMNTLLSFKDAHMVKIIPVFTICCLATATWTEGTREREFEPLRSINDKHEKVVLSMDISYVNSFEGIKIKNVVDFLLEKNKRLEIVYIPRHFGWTSLDYLCCCFVIIMIKCIQL